MTFIRVHPNFFDSPQALEAGPLALLLHIHALCYSSRHHTEGEITKSISRSIIELDGLEEYGNTLTASKGARTPEEWRRYDARTTREQR